MFIFACLSVATVSIVEAVGCETGTHLIAFNFIDAFAEALTLKTDNQERESPWSAYVVGVKMMTHTSLLFEN